MDARMDELLVILGVVGAAAVAYGKLFGSYQTAISEALIEAMGVESRYRRLLNLGVGVLLALAFTAVAALWLGSWEIMPAGVLAGILASVEAGKEHDAAEPDPEPPEVPPRTYDSIRRS